MTDIDPLSDIRNFRKVNRLSQQELATFLGVSQKTISRWERGVDTPGADILGRLCTLMGGGGKARWPAMFEAVRAAPVALALIDDRGQVLVASEEFKATHGGVGTLAPLAEAVATVLVVEDDRAVLKATRAALNHWRFVTFGAADGETAVRLVADDAERPALAIIDFLLPGPMDGVDTAFALRRVLPRLPILLISGEATPERLQKISQSGFYLLPKPVDPDRLKTILMFLMSRAPNSVLSDAPP